MKKHGGHFWVRAFWLLAVLAAGLLPQAGRAQTAATYHARADQALQSFLLKFWNGGQQYLRNKFPSDGSLTGYWTYANGWDAVLDGVERTGGAQYAGLIESLYTGQNDRGWTNNYYDDECWMTLALIRAYDLTTNTVYLNQAQALYADIQGGWDNTCCGSPVGGLWWDKSHTQKATAANAGAALAGAKLYQRTTNVAYLTFAQQVYSFWWANMVNQSTFQVCDHLDTAGNKVWWKFTYNEGLMIGASVALYEATGSSTYLNNAHNIANFMVNNEFVPTIYGNALYDGDNSGCGGDCHQFKAPGYRYLMQLYRKNTTKTAYYSLLKGSADAVWNLARETTNTIFAVNWAGPAQTNVDQGQQNAAVAALNLWAKQSGAYPGSGIPANRYEAENATVNRIAFETNYAGFTGWSYLAGWNSANQWVRFDVNLPSPGGRTLTFHYAGGAGNAGRLLNINGTNAFPNLVFANTGAWTTYSNVSVSYNFPVGRSSIAVQLNPALGNGNYLNLDSLTLTDLKITNFTVTPGGTVHLGWDSVAGLTYQVQYTSQLPGGSWLNLGGIITATNGTTTATDSMGGNSIRYYRVRTP
jgi:predicted alpha-1,6-mannanase (GH76 family)